MIEFDIRAWVKQATPDRLEFRHAVHTILQAIATAPTLKSKMILHGGILMSMYGSSRTTTDLDFSTDQQLSNSGKDSIIEELNESLAITSEKLDYNLSCAVQSWEIKPRIEMTFPSIQLKVGYAYKGTGAHKRLQRNQSPKTLKIDYCFNEAIYDIEEAQLNEFDQIIVYTLTDMIAEKFRSILQQKIRDRIRRQDSYDLYYLLVENISQITPDRKRHILESLKIKSKGKLESIDQNSISDPEVKKRSKADYGSLSADIDEELPEFELVYQMITKFYQSLPW